MDQGLMAPIVGVEPTASRRFAGRRGRSGSLAVHGFSAGALAAASLLGLPIAASAQTTYPVSTWTEPFVPLTGATALTLQKFGSTDLDEGDAGLSLPTGWTFTLFGKGYTTLTVQANMLILAGSATCSACYKNDPIPSTSLPNGFVAPWWNDMDGTYSNGSVLYRVAGASPARVLTVEYRDWDVYDGFSAVKKRSVQVRLFEAGDAIEFVYGPIATGTSFEGASVGLENDTGSAGVAGLACGAAATCAGKDWPASGTVVHFGATITPDIRVESVSVVSIAATPVATGPGLRVTTEVKLRNLGTTATGNFVYDLYTSSDALLDVVADTKVYSRATSVSIAGSTAGTATATFTDTFDIAKPSGSARLWFGLDADPVSSAKPRGDVLEASEANNTGITATALIVGVDLTGQVSHNLTSVGPGQSAIVHVVAQNLGSDPTGAFSGRLYLSLDDQLDTLDVLAHTEPLSLGGGARFEQDLWVTVPPAPPDKYVFLWVLDPPSAGKPDGDVAEADETNNRSATTNIVTVKGAELLAQAGNLRSPVPPYPVTTSAYIGEPVRAQVTVANIGDWDAQNFAVSAVLSPDVTISIYDQEVAFVTGVSVPAGGQTVVDIPFTLPTVGKDGQTTLAAGNYYFGLIADALGQVPQKLRTNDVFRVGPIAVRQPAMDLSVARLDVPPAAGAGELMPATWTFKNLGNRGNLIGGNPFTYRFVLSTNGVISAADRVLPVVIGGVEKTQGEARIDAGGELRGTDLVRVPIDVPPGTYTLGVRLDPDDAIAELDESNNAGPASGTTEVVAGSLRVDTRILPDAIVGVPYLKQLVAQGGSGSYAWAIDPPGSALPPGIGLSPEGILSGTPSSAGLFAFGVQVSSAGLVARAAFALRAAAPTTGLQVYTARLPPAVRGQAYQADLVAVGGTPPYAWSIASGVLPAGLRLSATGTVSGTATQVGTASVVVRVADAGGYASTGGVAMRVIDPTSVAIATTEDAFRDKPLAVGEPFALQLSALGGTPPYKWSQPSGALPSGLSVAPVGALTGVAQEFGNFFFGVRVEDTVGALDETQFQLTVNARPAVVKSPGLPPVRPGDEYSAQLAVENGQRPAWTLFSGELPPGLTLDARGSISGRVADDAAPRAFNFVVLVRTENGLEGMAALTIDVLAPPLKSPPPPGCGCGAGAMPGLWALAALAALLPRRRGLRGPAGAGLVRLQRGRGGAPAGMLALVAGLALPSAARAGYTVATTAETLVELTGGTPLTVYSPNYCFSGATDQVIALPFPLRFFGQVFTQVTAGPRGYLLLGAGTAINCYNVGLPSAATGSLIAPWWDDMGIAAGGTTWQVSGTSPRRAVTIQWKNLFRVSYTSQRVTLQVKIHETTGTIEFLYGASTLVNSFSSPSATVGIADAATAAPFPLTCTTSVSGTCSATNWPQGQKFSFAMPVDLVVPKVVADEIGFAGVPYSLTATVMNQGGTLASGAAIRAYLSADAALDTAVDTALVTATGIDLDAAERRDVPLKATLPSPLTQAAYYVFVVADPDKLIAEDSEANNASAAYRFTLGEPAGDLTGAVAVQPATVAPGGTVTVSREVRNVGNFLVGPCALDADCGGVGYTCDAGRCRLGCAQPSDCRSPYTCAARGVCDLAACTADAGCPGRESCQAGTCTARKATYALVLSDNAVISTADRLLTAAPGTATVAASLKAGDVDAAQDAVTVPAATPPGVYTVGIVLDPANQLSEINELNNTAAASAQITVATGTVQVTTSSMPDAATGAPYAAHLYAAGGSGSYTWALAGGSEPLPTGLTLASGGDISGMATQAGTFPFTVEVSSNGATATSSLQIRVADAKAPLTVVSTNLPTGEFGAPYTAFLVATGGVPPYTWALAVGSSAPPGLALAPDGTVEGTPRADGTFSFTAEVRDRASPAQVATAKVTMAVVAPASVRITTTVLPDAILGVDYKARLDTAGGRRPHLWEIVETRRLPTDPTDVPEPPSALPPKELELKNDATGWYLAGTPTFAGLYAVTFKVLDAQNRTDSTTLPVRVRYEDGVSIATRALPDALYDTDYRAQLAARGGVPPYLFQVACAIERDASGNVLPCRQRPPNGFTVNPDGLVFGRRNLTTLDPATPETTNFLVKLVDAQNRVDLRAFSLTLRRAAEPPVEKPAGCGCGDAAAGAPAAALLAAAIVGRRRRRG